MGISRTTSLYSCHVCRIKAPFSTAVPMGVFLATQSKWKHAFLSSIVRLYHSAQNLFLACIQVSRQIFNVWLSFLQRHHESETSTAKRFLKGGGRPHVPLKIAICRMRSRGDPNPLEWLLLHETIYLQWLRFAISIQTFTCLVLPLNPMRLVSVALAANGFHWCKIHGQANAFEMNWQDGAFDRELHKSQLWGWKIKILRLVGCLPGSDHLKLFKKTQNRLRWCPDLTQSTLSSRWFPLWLIWFREKWCEWSVILFDLIPLRILHFTLSMPKIYLKSLWKAEARIFSLLRWEVCWFGFHEHGRRRLAWE